MKIICNFCKKEYSVPDEKIPLKGATYSCKQCGSKIVVSPPTKTVQKFSLDNKMFTFAKPYLLFIDAGEFFRKPFTWLYTIFAALTLLFPLYILYQLIAMKIFSAGGKTAIAFVLLWLILAFSSWICFQIWWDRKSKLTELLNKRDEDFVATPFLSHFVQTAGESLGTYIGITGFGFALLTTILLGNQASGSMSSLGLPFIGGGLLYIIMSPILGFLIIVVSRFFSEQITVLAAIANNTKK